MQQWPTKLGADMDLTMIVQDKYNASEAGSTAGREVECLHDPVSGSYHACSGLGTQGLAVSTKLLPQGREHLGLATLAQQCMQ